MSRSFSLFSKPSPQKQFYEELCKKHIRLIRKTALRSGATEDNLLDIMQEAFLKLLQHYDTLKSLPPKALTSFISNTARNATIDFDRRKKSDVKREDDMMQCAQFSVGESPGIVEMIIQKEMYDELEAVLALLSETDQVLLIGKYFLEHSDAELAAQLGCKPSSVRMMLTRARRNALKLIQERGKLIDEE